MSVGFPFAGNDGVPSETSFAFANLTVEPASRNGMSAAAQAVGASARTRLGHGPRVKAHVDYGAWSRGRFDGSSSRSRASRGNASFSHAFHAVDAFGYGVAGADGADHDKSAFVNGSLLSDLMRLLEALGGAHPHPAATLLKRCVASHEDAHGAGATWSLALGAALCGAADRLRDSHGMDARSILDAFQECTRLITTRVVPALAAPVAEAAAAFRAESLDAAVAEARALIQPELEPGTVSAADARALAALVLGLDRGRHPGDAPLALAAALTLARRSPTTRDRAGETRQSDGADGEGGNDASVQRFERAASSGSLRLDHRDAAVGVVAPGPAASRSFIAPGAVLPLDTHVSIDSLGVADAFAEATKRAADSVFDLALFLDDEALAEADVEPFARAAVDCVEKALTADVNDELDDDDEARKQVVAQTNQRVTQTRLVLFRSDRVCEARVAATARALTEKAFSAFPTETSRGATQKNASLVAVAGPGVTRSTLRALARTVGGTVLLDALSVEPGDFARSVRVSVSSAGWNPDDTVFSLKNPDDAAAPKANARARRAFFDAPRRFAVVSSASRADPFRDANGEARETPSRRSRHAASSSFAARKKRRAASLVVFDRTETAANARAAEFRRTMRRVSNALADDGSGVGTFFVPGDDGLGSFLLPEHREGGEGASVFASSREPRRGRVLPGGGCFELAAAAALARESESESNVTRARAFDAFAECLRDVHRVASQNGGARFDDAVARGARAEALFRDAFSSKISSKISTETTETAPRAGVSVWRGAWSTLDEKADETADEPGGSLPKLEEARARVAGLHTAMGIARCVVAAGPAVTYG